MTDVTQRLLDLEERVARLEGADGPQAVPAAPGDVALLETLERDHPDSAAIVGSVRTEAGEARWQYGLTRTSLDELDWGERATALAALGHPVRLRLLQLVHRGEHRTSALAELDGVGSVGQVQHHLRTLLAAGWLESRGRGQVAIPTSRVIPLLATVLATSH